MYGRLAFNSRRDSVQQTCHKKNTCEKPALIILPLIQEPNFGHPFTDYLARATGGRPTDEITLKRSNHLSAILFFYFSVYVYLLHSFRSHQRPINLSHPIDFLFNSLYDQPVPTYRDCHHTLYFVHISPKARIEIRRNPGNTIYTTHHASLVSLSPCATCMHSSAAHALLPFPSQPFICSRLPRAFSSCPQ